MGFGDLGKEEVRVGDQVFQDRVLLVRFNLAKMTYLLQRHGEYIAVCWQLVGSKDYGICKSAWIAEYVAGT